MKSTSLKNNKNFAYFDHDADIGIIGRGITLEAAFIEAAIACFTIMFDISKIKPEKKISFEFEESDNEFAFYTWLNQLITQARIHGVVFSQFKLQHTNNHWLGEAYGMNWPLQADRGTEVKGATFTGLSVKKIDREWEARCVVDV